MLSRITTVIGTIAATVAELRARWVGRRVTWYSGLTTEADAETYVTVLRATPVTPLDQHRPVAPACPIREPLTLPAAVIPAELPAVPAWVDGWTVGGRLADGPVRYELPAGGVDDPPIFAALRAEFDARQQQRTAHARALRMPTEEMRTVFDRLTDDWRCSHCDDGRCADCPGCSCPCRLPTLAAVGVP